MRLVFMGTPVFAQSILQSLIESPHTLVGVYSQPPRPAGRGRRLQKSPVHELALLHDLEVFTPQSLKNPEEHQKLACLRPDVAIVAAYGLILPQAILDIPLHGCLNVHTSLLPRWRGAAPIQRAILAGDTQTGVTLMQMDKGLDTGDILRQETVALTQTTTAPDLEATLACLGARLTLKVLQDLEEGRLKATVQPSTGVTYAEKLSKTEGLLNWDHPATLLDRQIRALTPWPGTYFIRDTLAYRVKNAKLVDPLSTSGHPPGTVLDEHLTIQCGEGTLRLLELQKPGRAATSAKDFLNGNPIQVGTPIGDPLQDTPST